MPRTAGSRGAYRTRTVALSEVATLAARLVQLYSYEDADGRIEFEPEPIQAVSGSPAEWKFRVVSAWHALRTGLIAAGVLTGDGAGRPLGDGTAVFLRVEVEAEHSSGAPTWQRAAVFEVLRGVGSYSYADGKALDTFLEHKRLKGVRVVREVVPEVEREAYLSGDRSGVASSDTIGELLPGQWSPDAIADGWACIGDRSDDPEPGHEGVGAAALVLPMPGPQGVPGSVGPQGPRGVGIAGLAVVPESVPGLFRLVGVMEDGAQLDGGTFSAIAGAVPAPQPSPMDVFGRIVAGEVQPARRFYMARLAHVGDSVGMGRAWVTVAHVEAASVEAAQAQAQAFTGQAWGYPWVVIDVWESHVIAWHRDGLPHGQPRAPGVPVQVDLAAIEWSVNGAYVPVAWDFFGGAFDSRARMAVGSALALRAGAMGASSVVAYPSGDQVLPVEWHGPDALARAFWHWDGSFPMQGGE